MSTEAPVTDAARTAPEEATCLGCGYALRGLRARACPECGRAFDPADPLSMRTSQRIDRALRRALFWAPMSAAIATLVVLMLVLLMTRHLNALWLAAAVLLAAFIRRRARLSLLAGAPEPNPLTEGAARVGGWLLAGFVLLVAGGGFHFTQCPHGTLFGVGPVGIAHSTVGGPCRNRVPIQRTWNVTGNWYLFTANDRL